MQLYGGKLIHRSHDDLGVIEVVDEPHQRSLHFGTPARQSSLLLHAPDTLALSYLQAMLSALLFIEAPQKILLVGLGGGALAHFLLRHFPRAQIDAVEYRQAVVEVARSHFQLPDSPRLQIEIEDAGRFILESDKARFSGYDLILVDAFLDNGIAQSVCDNTFSSGCRERMCDGGLFSINLWSNGFVTSDELIRGIELSFPGATLKLPVEGKENIITLARRQGERSPAPRQQLKKLGTQAKELQTRYEIDFPELLKQLRRNNHGPFALFG